MDQSANTRSSVCILVLSAGVSDAERSDMVSAIFNAMQSLGEALGPIIGGGLTAAMPTTTVVNCSGTDCDSGMPNAAFVFGAILMLYALPLGLLLVPTVE